MATPFLNSPVLIMRLGTPGHSSRRVVRSQGRADLRGSSDGSRPDRSRRGRSGRECDDLAREPGQPLDTSGGGIEQHEVLDANAHLALEINARLDREDRRRRQRCVRGKAPERRLLVRGKTDAVTGAMTEMSAVASVLDDTPRDPVDAPAARQ